MQHFDFTALRYFSETAHSGSIRSASDRLHVTPSAVSRRIAKLEGSLNTRLFERRATGVVLTPSGRMLTEEMTTIYANLARVRTLISDIGGLNRGEVTVYCMEGAADSWLPDLVTTFRVRHPQIEFKIIVSSTDRSVEALIAGRCDIAVMFKAPHRSEIKVVDIGMAPLVVLASPAHKLALYRSIRFAQLLQYDLALPDESFGVRQMFDHHVKRIKCRPRCLVTTNSVAMTRSLVRLGTVVSMLPYMSARRDCELGLLKAIPISGVTRLRAEVQLCVHKDRPLTEAAREMLTMLTMRFSEIVTTLDTGGSAPLPPTPARA